MHRIIDAVNAAIKAGHHPYTFEAVKVDERPWSEYFVRLIDGEDRHDHGSLIGVTPLDCRTMIAGVPIYDEGLDRWAREYVYRYDRRRDIDLRDWATRRATANNPHHSRV